MRAVRLYPLSCALNRAARWTLDSWLACSVQLLLPSGRRRPKRQLLDTFGKVEKRVSTTGWEFSVCYTSKQAPAWLTANKRLQKKNN